MNDNNEQSGAGASPEPNPINPTPAPETPAPEAPTPAPEPAPEVPATPAPEAPAPETPAPEAPTPETPAPAPAPAPEAPTPASPAPTPGSQPIASGPAPAPTPDASAPKANKKKTLIICGAAVGAGVLILVIVLLVIFLGGGAKTVSCTAHESAYGIEVDGETNVKVTDGKVLEGDIRVSANLKSLNSRYAEYEEEIVDSIIDQYKSRCNSGCTFNHDYAKGDHLEMTMKFDSDGVEDMVYAYNIEDKSAQEIADEIQKTFEENGSVTCKQN